MIRVLIADDHTMIREGLKRIISESNDIDLVGEAEDGDAVLMQCKKHDIDVLLLDISMPGPGFMTVLQTVVSKYPATRVLVLSVNPEDHYAARAIRAGAAGYLTKNHTPAELAKAIRRVNKGKLYVSDMLLKELSGQSDSHGEHSKHDDLSEREYQILCMLGSGKQINKIAEQLSLSPKTISTYRNRILEKLELSTTGELVRYAVENDLHI